MPANQKTGLKRSDPESAFDLSLNVKMIIMAVFGGPGTIFGPIVGAIFVTILSLGLSDLTPVWQLYFGLIFIAVVVFAPGGITGLLMMHRPLLKAGTLTGVLPSYAIAFVPTLAMLVGLILSIETIVHFTVNPGDDSHIKAFGVSFDAASPAIWAMAAILLIGGFLVARKTWTWVGHAWDDATSVAREKEIAA